MLEGHRLTSVRDGRTLFKGLDLRLQPGQALHVQGANGAGKTTLLRILCGLTEPREGTVCWQGNDIFEDRFAYHRELLYVGHSAGIKQELTALENLCFLHGISGRRVNPTVLEQSLKQVGLYGYEDVLVRNLSAGQRRRVALARLWSSNAKLWVLDEPFTAIDRDGINQLKARLGQHLQEGGMAIVTSHQTLNLGQQTIHSLRL
jgi:heme exporter protein A